MKRRQKEKKKVEGLKAFKKSTKVVRSPMRNKEGVKRHHKMRAEFKEIMKKMKELQEDKKRDEKVDGRNEEGMEEGEGRVGEKDGMSEEEIMKKNEKRE